MLCARCTRPLVARFPCTVSASAYMFCNYYIVITPELQPLWWCADAALWQGERGGGRCGGPAVGTRGPRCSPGRTLRGRLPRSRGEHSRRFRDRPRIQRRQVCTLPRGRGCPNARSRCKSTLSTAGIDGAGPAATTPFQFRLSTEPGARMHVVVYNTPLKALTGCTCLRVYMRSKICAETLLGPV